MRNMRFGAFMLSACLGGVALAGVSYSQTKKPAVAYDPLPVRTKGVAPTPEGEWKEFYQDSCKTVVADGRQVDMCGNVNDLLRHDAGKFGTACGGGVEAIRGIYGYKGPDGSMRYYSLAPKSQKGDARSVSATFDATDSSLGVKAALKGTIHNHPATKGVSAAWFSNLDVISALVGGEEFTAVTDCETRQILKLNVAEIKRGAAPTVYFLDKYNDEDVKAHKLSDDGGKLCFDGKDDPWGDFNVCSRITDAARLRDFAGTREKFSEEFGHDAFAPSNFSALLALAERFKAEGPEGEPYATNGEESQKASVVVETGADSGEVGVKGWCRCESNPERRGAKSITVGMSAAFAENPVPGYVYEFCLCCGKCRRPGNANEIVIFDRELEVRLQKASNMRTSDYDRMRKAVQAKLMEIPDGRVVIPGKCTCKTPDPINSGYEPDERVCAFCGKCCEDARIGPTAWSIMQDSL